MNLMKKQTLLAVIIMATLALLPACNTSEPSRWDAAQAASEGGEAVSAEAIAGGEFNKFFPESSNGFEVVYTQEKDGFAQASLEKDGEEVATFSISDTASNPSAAEKYSGASDDLDGYPMVEIGSNGTGILVANRFQVQVRSKADDFNDDNRRSWLSAFDLDGLGSLQ